MKSLILRNIVHCIGLITCIRSLIGQTVETTRDISFIDHNYYLKLNNWKKRHLRRGEVT